MVSVEPARVRRSNKIALAMVMAVALLLALAAFVGRKAPEFRSALTEGTVRAIDVGWSSQQLVETLGEPFENVTLADGTEIWRYARQHSTAREYAAVDVHLRDGVVLDVVAKRMVLWGIESEYVYVRDASRTVEYPPGLADFLRGG